MSNRPNVIVADSNEQFLVYLSTLLGRMNFEVLAILNGAEAFDLARIVNPNLIFSKQKEKKSQELKFWIRFEKTIS